MHYVMEFQVHVVLELRVNGVLDSQVHDVLDSQVHDVLPLRMSSAWNAVLKAERCRFLYMSIRIDKK